MFNAVVFFKDENSSVAIERFALESKQISVLKSFNRFAQGYELARTLNTLAPDLVFLDLHDWESAMASASDIHFQSPSIAIIGFGKDLEKTQQRLAAENGVSALLGDVPTFGQFQQGVERAIHKVRDVLQENLIAFLPAKAGSGCTTVALNVAGNLAASMNQRVLMIEGDLHSGVLSSLLNVASRYSVLNALENSAELDYSRWTSYVVKSHGMDLLLAAPPNRLALPLWSDYHDLLQFAMSRYDTIAVDLPEVVNEATVEIVRRAKWCFVVSTLDRPALRLAQKRCEELKLRGIPSSRIGIILNRWHDSDGSTAQVEEFLQHSVSAVFRNDYPSVHKATTEARLVDTETKLGKSFLAFARKLVSGPEAPEPPKSRFGFFKSLAPKGAH